MIKAVAMAACASTALAATSIVASAQTLTEMSASIEACHLPHANVSDTVDVLAQQGWVLVPEGDLSSDTIELLIWPQVAFYANGDTGGEQLKAIVDLQRKTVAGFAKKKDIPQSKTRILTRQIGADAEAVLVQWLQPTPSTVNIICRFALSSASVTGQGSKDFGSPVTTKAEKGGIWTTTVLNADSLAAKINAPVTVSGIVQTQANFASGGN